MVFGLLETHGEPLGEKLDMPKLLILPEPDIVELIWNLLTQLPD
jgi:hypothetical protein